MERNCLRAMYPVLGISRNPINCMEQSALWKANSFSGSQENHDMGTEFGTSLPFFTGRCHWSLFWARWIQSIYSHPISIRFILILFSHLLLALSVGLFCSVFPISAMQAFFFFLFFPVHLILPDLVNLIIFDGEYKSWNSSLCSFLQPPITSFLLGLFPSTPFSGTFSVCVLSLVRGTKFYAQVNAEDQPNSSIQSHNLILSSFLREFNFNVSLYFQGIWTLPHFQRFCYLFYAVIL